ncbi:MAG: glycogen synthase [Anaerolineaceae bacterium]|nr:glycogen synthase [Anaerolineaceae bacterium]
MAALLRVLFMVAEAAPFIKVGGLGDVGGSLPLALNNSGGDDLDIRLAIPHHAGISLNGVKLKRLENVKLPARGGVLTATVHSFHHNGLTIYLIGGDAINTSTAVYMADPQQDGRKYTFFSLAALELTRKLNWAPDILHANDWHTTPAVTAIRTRYKNDGFFQKIRTVLTLHNLPYMGDGTCFPEFGLPHDTSSRLPEWARRLPLPLGLLHADRIIAVSPSYAHGILTEEFGCGLQDFLATRKPALHGILNGLDYTIWDPEQDKHIDQNYSTKDIQLRAVNKLALLESIGLNPKPNTPLLGMVSRLDNQKGIDLVFESLQALKQPNWQFILVGTGDPELENAARKLQAEFPDRVWVVLRYDESLAHQVYASADVLLMPSRYEPCGLAQLIAMRYGCVPVATRVGGLQDTIRDHPKGRGQTGFLSDRVTVKDFTATIRRVLKIQRDPPAWRDIQKRGMHLDFSWDQSAKKYIKLYHTLADE